MGVGATVLPFAAIYLSVVNKKEFKAVWLLLLPVLGLIALTQSQPKPPLFTLESKKVVDLTSQNNNRALFQVIAAFRYNEPSPTLAERVGWDDYPSFNSYSGWVEDSRGHSLSPAIGKWKNRTELVYWNRLPKGRHQVSMKFDVSDVPASAGKLRLTILMDSKDGYFPISIGVPNPKQ